MLKLKHLVLNLVYYIKRNIKDKESNKQQITNNMLIQKGAKGPHVTKIQKALDAAGFWTYGKFTEAYGPVTEDAVERFQSAKGLTIDGEVGKNTLKALGITINESVDVPAPDVDEETKYKGVTIKGSHFPDKPIKTAIFSPGLISNMEVSELDM